jgi:hypothetical protein
MATKQKTKEEAPVPTKQETHQVIPTKQETHQVTAECFLLEQAFIDNKVVPVAANFLLKSDTIIDEQTFKITNPSVLYGFEQGKSYAFTVFEL